MKMRRRTGVNGVRENHRDTVVNQGGTAESFGPLSGRKARSLRKNTGQDTSQKKQKQRRKKRRTLWQKKKNW